MIHDVMSAMLILAVVLLYGGAAIALGQTWQGENRPAAPVTPACC